MTSLFPSKNDTLDFETWLTEIAGVSHDGYEKLKSFGCNSISMLKACTESDIEDIAHDTNIKKIDKLKLKVAIKKINERDDNKHLIIEMEERNAMIAIHDKIKELERALSNMDTNQMNHILMECQQCENQINDTFQRLYQSLHTRHDALMDQLHHICDQKKHQLLQNKQNLTAKLQESIHIKQECHKLVNQPTEIEQLNDRKETLRRKAQHVCSIQYPDECYDGGGDIVVFKSYLNSLLKIHTKFGDVYNIKYIRSDEWDVDNTGDHVLVQMNNKMCLNNIDNEYQSVFGRCVAVHGVHRWKLKIIKTTYHMLWNTMIGVLQIKMKRKVRNTYFTENAHSYAFIGNCAVCVSNENNDAQPKYGAILKNGSIVDVILDCNKHTLKYCIDGKDYGTAYQRIPQTKYCLAVTMTQKKDQIQLMSYVGQQYTAKT